MATFTSTQFAQGQAVARRKWQIASNPFPESILRNGLPRQPGEVEQFENAAAEVEEFGAAAVARAIQSDVEVLITVIWREPV